MTFHVQGINLRRQEGARATLVLRCVGDIDDILVNLFKLSSKIVGVLVVIEIIIQLLEFVVSVLRFILGIRLQCSGGFLFFLLENRKLLRLLFSLVKWISWSLLFWTFSLKVLLNVSDVLIVVEATFQNILQGILTK